MRSNRTKIIAAAVAAAAILLIIVFSIANRPLVTAPKGTAPLDNKLDTAAVSGFVVDEANVLAEETEQIISIYNANWLALAGRCMAVVTVESTENAEADAWKWAQKLSLGKNDALLLMEAASSKRCALVANGTFREDLETLKEGYLERLTYLSLRAGEFDTAALAVCERMHYFYGYDMESHRLANVTEGIITISIIAALVLPILIHWIGEKIDNRRFKRWYDNYGVADSPIVPWRTVFFWHRAGSSWYEQRMSGEWVDIHANIISNRRTQRAKSFRAGVGGRRR